MSVVRIPSKLYFDLFTKGNEISGLSGDKLIAVYCLLKSSRNGGIKYTAYKSKNNKNISGFSLLRNKTVLSLHVIEKYLPVLIDSGVCFIDNNGDFVLLGGEKVKELYNSYKIVPIKIGKNLNETATNCFSVRLHAEELEQSRMILKKQHRSELIKQSKNPHNNKEYKQGLKLIKKYGENIDITDKAVLSNQAYALLKDNSSNNKSKGSYWKRKLIRGGVVKSRRRFELLEKMDYGNYLRTKKFEDMDGRYTYIKGCLALELVSSFTPVNLVVMQ